MNTGKAGIYTHVGKKGENLRNIATGEVILSPEAAEDIEDVLYDYIKELEPKDSEYCIVKGKKNGKTST